MRKTKDKAQTGKKNPKNERIASCIDELKHLRVLLVLCAHNCWRVDGD